MQRSLLYLFPVFILFGFPAQRIWAQEVTPTLTPQPIVILQPIPGQALQGLVTIVGNLAVPGFISAEVSFTYHNDPRDTWFLIEQLNAIPIGEAITEWDTTILTDGEYDLRVLVDASTGPITIEILGLRVRNYSSIETDTPAPTASPAPQDTPIPTPTETTTETPIPSTSTPLPTNPARISDQDVLSSMGRGALLALGFFALLGLYQAIRSWLRRH
jgi:hypothetical protein